MGIIAKIRSLFKKGKPVPPKVPKLHIGKGHRGVHAISLKLRYDRMARGEEPYSPEEIQKWKTTSADEGHDFIYNSIPLFTHSSTIAMMQYFIEDSKLMVEFHSGGKYLYSNISPQEANEGHQALSKGSWLHNWVKKKGKPFVKLS